MLLAGFVHGKAGVPAPGLPWAGRQAALLSAQPWPRLHPSSVPAWGIL